MKTKTIKDSYLYIPSTEPGLTWCLYSGRQERGPVYIQATEGTRTYADGNATLNSFNVRYGGPTASRQVREVLSASRLTDKAHVEGIRTMREKLARLGTIASADAESVP